MIHFFRWNTPPPEPLSIQTSEWPKCTSDRPTPGEISTMTCRVEVCQVRVVNFYLQQPNFVGGWSTYLYKKIELKWITSITRGKKNKRCLKPPPSKIPVTGACSFLVGGSLNTFTYMYIYIDGKRGGNSVPTEKEKYFKPCMCSIEIWEQQQQHWPVTTT